MQIKTSQSIVEVVGINIANMQSLFILVCKTTAVSIFGGPDYKWGTLLGCT